MKTKSAKEKGRRLQKWIVEELMRRFPEITDKDIKSTPMGTQGTDVLLSQSAFERFPFYIEAKNRSKIAVYEYYDQPATKDNVLLIIKQNFREPLAVIDAQLFMDIIKELYDLKKNKIH